MDATRGLRVLKNQSGVALVLVAVLMVAFGAFLALAIDIGYRHVTKGQLQNAADAAALAGAARLDSVAVDPFSQRLARAEAVDFAARNKAANKLVEISSDGSNTLSAQNDVRVGNWSNLTHKFDPTLTPVNALQVRARRTGTTDVGGASTGGPIDLFFARLVAPRWSQIGVSATATAFKSARAGFYITLGKGACGATGEQALAPDHNNMAWTSLLNPSTNATDLRENYLCPADNVPNVEICDKSIYTSNGTGNTSFQAAETDFFDPEYDRSNKSYDPGGGVSTWNIIVPVVDANDPTLQPGAQPVWGFARIVITRSCGTGNGVPCTSRPITAPDGICKNAENDIVISSIECFSCSSSSSTVGATPGLVE